MGIGKSEMIIHTVEELLYQASSSRMIDRFIAATPVRVNSID